MKPKLETSSGKNLRPNSRKTKIKFKIKLKIKRGKKGRRRKKGIATGTQGKG